MTEPIIALLLGGIAGVLYSYLLRRDRQAWRDIERQMKARHAREQQMFDAWKAEVQRLLNDK